MKLSGRSLIGFESGTATHEVFYATNPKSGERLEPGFFAASPDEVDRAVSLSHQAFATYDRVSARDRGAFLRTIAANIESIAEELVERAEEETALPKPRLQGETARTCGQLRMFAQVAEEGSWVQARIDRADPNRKPAPKPDIRSMLRPLGPVVVFGASNFPLAFSVAGGDTASALAAGNPVIFKGHPAHPGTSELVSQAVQQAVRQCNFPEGVFSLLFDSGNRVGAALIKHPVVKAAGFTGSRTAGRILMDLAAARPEPIPFLAEMSSTNPVFILPGALRERADSIAAGLYSSFTLGAGQFCTKPGLVFLPALAEASDFIKRLQLCIDASAPFHLLTSGIRSAYGAAISARKSKTNVGLVAEKQPTGIVDEFSVGGVLFETDARSFLADENLAAEIFGPATLLVRHSNREELLEAARNLDGHLTATIHGTKQDLEEFTDLIAILERKVGRLVFNGFPTGVEVSHAMVHGGPYPATSDGVSTSVGSQAIFRFCRPVCYQGFPQAALPDALKDANPLHLWRMIDGEMTREPIPSAVTPIG
ncbi:MAG: aldehyde dehydrogenase (NADP(+)) [Terriglobales bacterium]|jgi:NADP-dependent aldehyde dehydrogenase